MWAWLDEAGTLGNGEAEAASLIERHLFDLGYLVHVVEEVDHLAQAVRTGFQAGLISILFGPAAEDASALAAGIPADQIVTLGAVCG